MGKKLLMILSGVCDSLSKIHHNGDPCDGVYVDLGDKRVINTLVHGIPRRMCIHINVGST